MLPTRRRIGRLAFGLLVLSCFLASAGTPAAESRRPPRRPRGAQRSTPDLAGTEWVLRKLCGRDVLDGVRSTIGFPEAGKVAGNGGCNRYFGPVRIAGDRIEIGHLASTRMACPPAVLEQEGRLLNALRKAERLSVEGRMLVIHSAGFARPLEFARLTEEGKAPGGRARATAPVR